MKKFSHYLEEKGLWDNIHAKRKRIKAGSGEKMRKPGSKGAPTDQNFKDASEETVSEISNDAIHNYVKAAMKDYKKQSKKLDDPFMGGAKKPETRAAAKAKYDKRHKGLGSAFKRDLAKKSSQRYVHRPTMTDKIMKGDKDTTLTTKSADQLHKRYKDR